MEVSYYILSFVFTQHHDIISPFKLDIVVQDDLVEALQNRTIFSAGLDVSKLSSATLPFYTYTFFLFVFQVMTPEPLPHDHPLTKLPNCGRCHTLKVIFLSHYGFFSYLISINTAPSMVHCKYQRSYVQGGSSKSFKWS